MSDEASWFGRHGVSALVAVVALAAGMHAACSLALGIDDRELIGGPLGAGGQGGSPPIQGPACEKADDCPGEDTPCLTRTCEDGHCASTKAAEGTALPEQFQTPANCSTVVCDAEGGVTTAPSDPPDPPNDGKQCTKDVCTSGTPSNPPEANATACSEGGGKLCDGAGHCVQCLATPDCMDTSLLCQANACVPVHCGNGSKDLDETDQDCGGSCTPCNDGLGCSIDADCKSKKCDPTKHCKAPACDDGVMNGPETDVDCGGGCKGCGVGEDCNQPTDCASSLCVAGKCAPSCTDGVQNNNETDVDCGFGCPPCGVGQNCMGPGDCQTGICYPNVCCAPFPNPCANGCGMQPNGCGSFVGCQACGPGSGSSGPGSSGSSVSSGGPGSVGSGPGCLLNFVQDGNETDVDCGGGMCPPCASCKGCNTMSDCQPGLLCGAGICCSNTAQVQMCMCSAGL